MREGKMWRTVTERLAYGDAFSIQCVGNATNGGLCAFLVNIPALEVFDRSGVHHDQGWMDDGTGIHQCAGQRIAAGLYHAGKGAADHGERIFGVYERKYADRQ